MRACGLVRLSNNSVYDKQLGTGTTDTSMRRVTITDVIAHSRLENKSPAISQASFQLPFKTQKHMSFGAPVIRLVPRRVLDHAHANRAKILGPPQRNSRIARMFGYRNFAPVGSRESCRQPFPFAEYNFKSGLRGRCQVRA